MPLLSSFLLIQSAAAALIALSTLLITSPSSVLSSTTLSLLGASMHIRPATFIPEPAIPTSKDSMSKLSSNPLTSLTRSTKSALTVSERELVALLGLVLLVAAISTIVLAAPLRFSRSGLTSRTTSDGKVVRKSSPEVGESIAKLNLVQTTWQIFAGIHVVAAALFISWMYIFQSQKYAGAAYAIGAKLRAGDVGDAYAGTLLANDVSFTIGMVDMLFWGYLYTTVKEERRIVLEVAEYRRGEDEEDEANRTS